MNNYNLNNNRSSEIKNIKKAKSSKLTLKLCKDNTLKSLYEVENFLNNFNNIFKYIKLYKILK